MGYKQGRMEEVEVDLRSTDPLGFPDYPARLKKAIFETIAEGKVLQDFAPLPELVPVATGD